ncbi:phage baseplate protein [Cupriavidus sp. USMAA2-4]|uniref:phage baseplate protein n=1 Tax=Cupriavidus sp. USMAA2-4 TaxID=876364 RepID=UPI003002B54F
MALQQSRKPFDVVTTRRVYNNMLLTGLTTVTDAKTFAVLIVKATLREVTSSIPRRRRFRRARTRSARRRPPRCQNAGTKAAIPGNPGAGRRGAVDAVG